MPSEDFNTDELTAARRKAIAETIHPIGVEELKALTATMPGARDVFDFDWTLISQHADATLTDARRLVKRSLTEAPVAFPGHEHALSGVAAHFINQLRSTLRQMSIK